MLFEPLAVMTDNSFETVVGYTEFVVSIEVVDIEAWGFVPQYSSPFQWLGFDKEFG
ncbi:hypothetical protein G9A89_006534 [Geosiphon pyriformis]|nr:hypothetical protein G9A89_006534 [Geosiphon pyriformis]